MEIRPTSPNVTNDYYKEYNNFTSTVTPVWCNICKIYCIYGNITDYCRTNCSKAHFYLNNKRY